MRKIASGIITLTGIILLAVGVFIQIPNKELTTYPLLEDEYTLIEEYVGGDAYNYIIGASLVGGEIAGAKAQKAIFICVGILIASIGFLSLVHGNEVGGNKIEAVASKETEGIVPENPIPDSVPVGAAGDSEKPLSPAVQKILGENAASAAKSWRCGKCGLGLMTEKTVSCPCCGHTPECE